MATKKKTEEVNSVIEEAIFDQVEYLDDLESKKTLPNNSIIRVTKPEVVLYRLSNQKFLKL